MDFLISSGIFAIVLVVVLIVFGSGPPDGDRSRAKEMLARVTSESEDALAIELLRSDSRRRTRQGLAFRSLYALQPLALALAASHLIRYSLPWLDRSSVSCSSP